VDFHFENNVVLNKIINRFWGRLEGSGWNFVADEMVEMEEKPTSISTQKKLLW
jgi:hypothetical protein